ncbi:hypothetical protein JCM8097_003201 [Rhodosporidiobolus ruineniae]
MASQTVYLVSGANRGIGFEVVKQLSSRMDVLIFAGARTPDKADALNSLARVIGKIEVVKLESPNEEDAQAVAKVIEEKAGKLDVLIANAGIANYYLPLVDCKPSYFREMFEVNTLGPLVLFQATHHLLAKFIQPKFLAISSTLGSSETAAAYAWSAYGTSKAALNHIVAHAHHDHSEITSVAICPGWVSTDLGNAGAKAQGVPEGPPVKPADSAAAIVKFTERVSRESHGGKLWRPSEDEQIPF